MWNAWPKPPASDSVATATSDASTLRRNRLVLTIQKAHGDVHRERRRISINRYSTIRRRLDVAVALAGTTAGRAKIFTAALVVFVLTRARVALSLSLDAATLAG